MRRAVVSLFGVGLAASCSSPPKAPAREPAATQRQGYRLAPISRAMLTGITTAMRALSAAPRFELGDAPGTFQLLTAPAGDQGLRVFVVAASSAYQVPELCALRRERVEICDDNACRSFDGRKAPLVLCNGRALRSLDVLFRLEHAPGRWEARTMSDAAFIETIRAVEHEPEVILRDVRPDVTEPHLGDHWAMFSLFVLGHEMAHWLETRGSGVASVDEPSRDGLFDAQICRNYDEYGHHGWSLFGHPTREGNTLEDDHEPVGPALATVTSSTAIWKSELAADETGIKVTVDTVVDIERRDPQLARDAVDDFVGDLSLVAMWLWYRRVDTLLSGSCPAQAKQRFALTRCVCATRDNWRTAAASLLSGTHPPFMLRAFTAIERLLAQGNIEPTERIAFHRTLLGALQDGVMHVAFNACAALQFVKAGGVVFSQLPALEGERRVADVAHLRGKDAYLLYPLPAEAAEIEHECLRLPTP